MVLEPVTDDGLRSMAMTSRMGNEERLRESVKLVREAALQMHRGAQAVEPEHGGRQEVPATSIPSARAISPRAAFGCSRLPAA
jgi:hypothetical protein